MVGQGFPKRLTLKYGGKTKGSWRGLRWIC